MVAKNKTEIVTFRKEQLLKSKKYEEKRDLLNALLETGQEYTLETVDELIEKFMKEGVK